MKNLEDMSVSELGELLIQESRQRTTKLAAARIAAAKKSVCQADRLRQEEAAGEVMFNTVAVGAIVKVTGIRNKRFPFRQIVSINGRDRTFIGRQCAFNRHGQIEYGSEFPTHMANKIRLVLKEYDGIYVMP